MKGNTLQFYNKLTGGFVRLHPDGIVDAVGEKTDKYGKITGQSMCAVAVLGAGKRQISRTSLIYSFASFSDVFIPVLDHLNNSLSALIQMINR